ncbi:hypothetical protein K2X30_06575 [bacterium]|jgi:hypothetical protein|nr:hypothetical protein [bacterium]
MADSKFAKIGELYSQVIERITEQAWFQQIKAKWDELDHQSKTYVKYAAWTGSILLIFFVVLSSIWNVYSLKRDLSDKADLLSLLQNANDEIRGLREATPALSNIAPTLPSGSKGAATNDKQAEPWRGFIETIAGNAGIDKANLNYGTEKTQKQSDVIEETVVDLALKAVSIKQVVRFAFQLENAARPIKLRNLTIDTKADPQGYMDATLAVSAFAFKAKK